MMFESSQLDNMATAGGYVSSNTQSTGPSPTSAKSRDNQPMYPVTVKQIMEAIPSTDVNFLIDGVDVYNVKLIGMVYDKDARHSDVSFVIDDGTGRIDCRKWVNDSQDRNEVEGLMDGIYVRIHGHLKAVKGKKQLVVYAIRSVTDYNEIANHFLECIHAHCCNTRLQNGSAPTSSSPAVGTPTGKNAVTPTQFSQEYNVNGLQSIDKMVLDYLEQPSSLAQEKGIHISEIAKKVKMSEEKIMQAIASLESEGVVYSTIDEFHVKSVNASN